MKSINKSWQDLRIAAINRISKKRNLPSNPDSPYWDEYCKIMDSSHCKNKKEYKEKYKND
mgnify:CR=1 FL=1|tara:strand:- start:382 stop:561 length:180 start_codon:yes stop_codon:yes gene_type:complete